MLPSSVTQDQFLTSLRYLVVGGGSYLMGRGLISSQTLNAVTEVGLVVGPLLWGLYVNWQKTQQVKVAAAVGIQAGINMTVAGRAVDANGQTIQAQMPDGAPPKQVTLETATPIMKEFAPSPSAIAKS